MCKITTLGQLAQLLNYPLKSTISLSGVSVDTRLLKAGEVFFALTGAQVDGHHFLNVAYNKGAVAAVVNKHYDGSDYGLPLIRVPDTLLALQTLAKEILQRRNSQIVGVTGSIGKTTTKDFITALLKQKFRVSSSPGNSNSQIGLPLAIINHTTGDEQILVLEMGMTMAGQIKKLIEIAPPHVAVLTTVALVHACNFESLNDIAKAKGEIFLHPRTAVGILPRDVEDYSTLVQMGDCPKISFSTSSDRSDYYFDPDAKNLILHTPEGDIVNLGSFQLPGKHNRHNLLAAIVCARQFHLEWDVIQSSIESLALPERRLEILSKRGVLFVNDSYNASAVSVKAALHSLPSPQEGGKRIAVLGEMLELGKFSEKAHYEVGKTALECVDEVCCYGQECLPIQQAWHEAGKPIKMFQERQEIVEHLRQVVKPGDVVLLKGSRAKKLWLVLEEF